MKRLLRSVLGAAGYDVVRRGGRREFWRPPDFDQGHADIAEAVWSYTLTSVERIHACIESARHVAQEDIDGAIVECGVYKGGAMMAMAMALLALGVDDRELYLFDTFEGMPAPEEVDRDRQGRPVREKFERLRLSEVSSEWSNAPLEAVQAAMASTGYPAERIHYIKGLVEDTIPGSVPDQIAVLRLDTDWYRSTRHELVELYPRVVPGGLVSVDDYGHFTGARQAVDEFLAGLERRPFLHRIDDTGRLMVKPG